MFPPPTHLYRPPLLAPNLFLTGFSNYVIIEWNLIYNFFSQIEYTFFLLLDSYNKIQIEIKYEERYFEVNLKMGSIEIKYNKSHSKVN